MKNILPYLVVFLLSSGAAAVLIAVLLLVQPELLPVAATMPADSLSVAAGTKAAEAPVKPAENDTMKIPAPDDLRTDSVHAEPQLAAEPADSTTLALVSKRTEPAPMAETIRTTMDSSLNVIAGADSVQAEQRKSMAKVLEAMDPESAARILNDFPDGDVKQIILTIKRRQAAKILAALDPNRAARIMR